MNQSATLEVHEATPMLGTSAEPWALYQLTDKLYRAASATEVFEAALDTITQTLGCARASILLFDPAGIMQFIAWRGLSDHYRQVLAGHSPWKFTDKDPSPIFVRDIEETSETDFVKATIRNENIRS